MTVAAIVATLAKEFSVAKEEAQAAFDLLSSGLRAPYIARFQRARIGSFSEGSLRRLDRRRRQLEELGRRRTTLLKALEQERAQAQKSEEQAEAGAADKSIDEVKAAIEATMDRGELEDLFQAHRRPEPEVQLALDRGLGRLADELVKPTAKGAKAPAEEAKAEEVEQATPSAGAESSAEAPVASNSDDEAKTDEAKTDEPIAEGAVEAPAEAEGAADAIADAGDAPVAPVEEAPAAQAESDGGETTEASSAPASEAAPAAEGQDPAAKEATAEGQSEAPAKGGKKDEEKTLEARMGAIKIEVSPELARLCVPFVNPDRGVHTDRQALEGALRILADRLARNPRVRGMVRHLVRKQGRLSVRAITDEKKLGRNRSLLKLKAPLRQLQGHQLLALRQAQIQRQVATTIQFDNAHAVPKLRAALGKRLDPSWSSVIDAVVDRALTYRILPMIEEDLRAELRERADEEAMRFLAQHLRQVLLAPVGGRRRTAGIDVNAKGDWTIVVVDEGGIPLPPTIKVEVTGKTDGQLADELSNALRDRNTRALAIGHGKGAREAVLRLRTLLHMIGADAYLFLVNEAGLGSYANSELGRQELPEHTVPERMAISVARRFQDPLCELLKVDPRHLGLGREQSVVSKANLRRILSETVESCVAAVGAELNSAPVQLLRHLPGIDFEAAKKLVARRAERPFESREELLSEGLLDELRFRNAAGFVRVRDGQAPLDRMAVHPELHQLVERIVAATGKPVEDILGRRDAVKGLKRADFEIDEHTWRDIVRELSFPGRDLRYRMFPPELLAPDADPATLEKDTVVEGLVSNVASFGAFVDLGIPRDGMIHISEISDRYVRDARGLLSIGQLVRARVLDGKGQRVELSLKKVPDRPREPRGGPRRGNDREGRGGGKNEAFPEYQPTVRAARSRRDGLAGAGGGEKRRGGGRRPGGPGKGGRPRRGAREEGYDPAAIREASAPKGSYNPFANFFQGQKDETPGDEGKG